MAAVRPGNTDGPSIASPTRVGLELPAICLGNTLGGFGLVILPLWVAALRKARVLNITEIGWLATLEMSAIALSVLAVSAWSGQTSPRRIVLMSSVVILIANLIAMIADPEALVLGRLLSGVAMGAMLSAVTRVAACRADAQQVIAKMQLFSLFIICIAYFVSPSLLALFGYAGSFFMLVLLSLVTVPVARAGLPTSLITPAAAARKGMALTRKLAPLIGALAVVALFMGQSTLDTYSIVIGNGLGIDTKSMGTILAINAPLAMLGPLAATKYGERAGLIAPIIVAEVLVAVGQWLLVQAASPILFGLTYGVLGVIAGFGLPYVIALLARLDRSGRFAAAAPACIMIGSAIGPALGGHLIGAASFQPIALAAIVGIGLSVVLFVTAALLAKINLLGHDSGCISELDIPR